MMDPVIHGSASPEGPQGSDIGKSDNILQTALATGSLSRCLTRIPPDIRNLKHHKEPKPF